MDALMPNTGTLLRHLTRAAVSTPPGLSHSAQGCEPRATLGNSATTPVNPERVASDDPSLRFRKYIVVEHDGREHAIAFPLSIQHDRACPVSAGRLISAGSFGIARGRVVLTGMGSGTLNLNSRPQDAQLIEALFSES